MPDGAMGEDCYNTAAIRSYAITHARSWYEFINVTLGREAPNGSLYVVTGSDKSTAWGIATTEENSSSRSFSLQFTAVKAVAGANYSCSWSSTGGAVVRNSIASDLGDDTQQPPNQCLFLRGFKLMLREGFNAWMKQGEVVSAEAITDHSSMSSLLRTKSTSFPGTSSAKKSWASHLGSSLGSRQSKRDESDEAEMDPHIVCIRHNEPVWSISVILFHRPTIQLTRSTNIY